MKTLIQAVLIAALGVAYPVYAGSYGDPEVRGIRCTAEHNPDTTFSKASCVKTGRGKGVSVSKHISEDWELIGESEVSTYVGKQSWQKTSFLRQYDKKHKIVKYIIAQSGLGNKHQVRMITVPVE